MTTKQKPIDAAKAVHDADQALVAARERAAAAKIALRTKRADLAKSIQDWQAQFERKTPDLVHREHLKRLADYAVKIRNGEIAEHKPVAVPPTWPIEIALRAGKSTDCNQNYKRPPARGPKVPSLR